MRRVVFVAALAAAVSVVATAVPSGADEVSPPSEGAAPPYEVAAASGTGHDARGATDGGEHHTSRALADGWLDHNVSPRGARTIKFGPGASGPFKSVANTLVAQLRSEVGMNITVGGDISANRLPQAGELLVMIGTGTCADGQACSTVEADRGTVWMAPALAGVPLHDRQHLLADAIGFNYGIGRNGNRYLDVYQVKRNAITSDVYLNMQATYQAGDINGMRTKWQAGGGAAPTGSGATPSAPAGFGLRRKNGAVAVGWTTPGWRGASVTQYQVETKVGSAAATTRTVTTRGTTITGLANGTPVQVRVRASNASGWGPWTAARSATPRPATGRFASVEAASAWAQTNLGRALTSSQISWWKTRLASGDSDFTELVAAMIYQYQGDRDLYSVYRLYQAYFLRSPDSAGLDYWGQKRFNGTSREVVSQGFAASPEFRETYGRLSNAQFVDLVYRNVLGRSPDASGRSYWTNQLDRGVSRGSVMIGFSQAPEYRAITDIEGTCAITGRSLLRTIPPKAKRDQCVAAFRNGSAQYGDRLEVYLYDPTFR